MTDVELNGERGLVARLKARDGDAFDELYAAYHPRLFNFLARLTRRRNTAEELVEELWLRVVSAAPRLRDDTRLAPWLFTIARNIYASYCRARVIPFDTLDAGGVWPIPSPGPSPFEAAVATQLQQRVEVALATLPGSYREVLLLVAVEGFSPAEAAVVCGVSSETMRQRLSRARAALSERLEVARPRRSAILNEVLP